MKYDFDRVIDRRGTSSFKWDNTDPDVLPLWVADMDFAVAPAITDALRKRIEHPIFGYVRVPDSYYQAVTDWFARRHHWEIDREWIIYTTGVVPAVSAIIKALALPGEGVMMATPVYNCFYSSIRNDGCVAVEVPMLIDEQGLYRMDFDAMEQAANRPDVKVFLLCNPHNPGGRIWTRDELTRIGEICLKAGVTVISDEIHCEFTRPSDEYTPFATISTAFRDNCVSCISASKAFNIAGLQAANIVCADPMKRSRIDRVININEVCDLNPMGVVATQAAYNESEDWLLALNDYIFANMDFLTAHFAQLLPHCRVMPLQGTYLAWIDIRSTGLTSDQCTARLLEQARVLVNSGSSYGAAGEGYIRINLACPRTTLATALTRITPVLGIRR